MSVVRSLTFEKLEETPLGGLYDITSPIPSGTLVLSSARIDLVLPTPGDYETIPKSISLEIGTIVGNSFVIDNDVSANYFKVILKMDTVVIGGVTYLTSLTYPNTSFRMNGDLNRQCVFRIRSSTGDILDPAYFCFHFTAVSPF